MTNLKSCQLFFNMKPNLVIAFYAHQEHYPPTLNAIDQMAEMFGDISILYRNHERPPNWPYPKNVTLCPSGDAASIKHHEATTSFQKIAYFAKFVWSLAGLIRSKKPAVVLLYDPHALSAYSFAKKIAGGKHIVWYHNHDVLEGRSKNPLSITSISRRREPKMFPSIDLFTLPSDERKKYFPMEKLKGKYFFLPNLPSISFYGKNTANGSRTKKDLRIIFQGNLCAGHGFEEIISLLPLKLNGRNVKLVLAGWLRGTYKDELLSLIEKNKVKEYVEFSGFVPYKELPKLTASCHIGNAIYADLSGVMHSTVGTASNKIYEYAAVGIPVLYYDAPHFKKHLGKHEWAIPTDLSRGSLLESLNQIVSKYDDMSGNALVSFRKELNYEKHFQQIKGYLNEKL